METAAHQNLKRLAIAFLRAQGCQAWAMEVRCPIARFRVDVAGYQDRLPHENQPGPPRRCEPRTIVIECKQSRADFLRDSEHLEELLAYRAELDGMRRSIEEHRIKRVEPQLLRGGTSLFAELEEWDFAASRLPGYRKVLRQLRRVDEKLHGETKFFLMARYRLADRLYLATPRGMIRKRELPPGWGLLECPAQWLNECGEGIGASDQEREGLAVRVEAPSQSSKADYRIRVLRNIAVAASGAALNHQLNP